MPSTLDAKKISNTHSKDGKTFQNGNGERKMLFLGQWV
jgi:hypothetical protein